MSTAEDNVHRMIQSLSKETRYCILECSVFLEEKVSETLGDLLDIEWKKSESLGYGRSGLSFHNKVCLITDLNKVPPLAKGKFQAFMAIRNKFAHIAEIDSFSSYFQQVESSKDREKDLNTWYPFLKWDTEDIEGVYKVAYFLLALDLFRILFEISIKFIYHKSKEEARFQALEEVISSLKVKLSETDSGREMIEEVISEVFNKKDTGG